VNEEKLRQLEHASALEWVRLVQSIAQNNETHEGRDA
jgi:hypothetical protein